MSDSPSTPPPAQGVRLNWQDIPAPLRTTIEQELGSPVVHVDSQTSGFSPGVAARLQTASGRRVFIKALGPEPNPGSREFHRREARNMAAMPASAPVPRMLWWLDDAETGWVVLLFEDVDGWQPAQPWRTDELNRVLAAMIELSASMTPAPLRPPVVGTAPEAFMNHLSGWWRLKTFGDDDQFAQLDEWTKRHIDELAQLEEQAYTAAAGDTLLHFDIRADNVLLTDEKVWFVDWPHAHVGAAWVDCILFAPSVWMQGGPPPDDFLVQHPAYRAADPGSITAVIAAVAGFFTWQSLQPPPPGLPTVRAFQAVQGTVTRKWLARRTGWQ